jgi:preprotein translocase SecE subunit
MITSLRRYFKSISVEMNKVSWMTRPQILNSTFIVGVFALIITIFLFVLDNGLSYLVKILFQGDVG